MSDIPVVSVVIPLYNKRASVGRALESVCRQTVRDIEILVVDDGSSDGSAEVVETVQDPRIRLIRQPNAGPNQARNNAIAAARSDLIAFIDADDEWTPAHLANILKARERFPRCGVYATNFYWVQPDGSRKDPTFPGLRSEEGFCLVDNYFAVSNETSITTCSSVALTRTVLDEVGGFPVTEFIKQAHALWIKIALNYPIAFSTEPSLVYRLDAENRWDAHIRKIKSQLEDCDTVLLQTLDDALARRDFRNPSVTIDDIKTFRRKVLFWRASDLLRIGQRRKARLAAIKALATREYSLRSLKLIVQSFSSRQT